jgi:hypothetical protein
MKEIRRQYEDDDVISAIKMRLMKEISQWIRMIGKINTLGEIEQIAIIAKDIVGIPNLIKRDKSII